MLEKDSSVLGYPGEISKAIDADHHNICKFNGPQDPNYVIVRNVLKSLVSKIISKSNASHMDQTTSRRLKALLGIWDLPMADYIYYKDQLTQGTNQWILHDEIFQRWRDVPETSTNQVTHHLLWISGGPATGKSVVSAFLVNHLIERGFRCQYFFIRFGDQKKRTLSLMLRSLAYQIAVSVPGILQKLIDCANEGIDFETADPRVVWDRIFKTAIFQLKETQPLYWVIDGLDEGEDPRMVIKLFADLPCSTCPIRVLFTSRQTSDIGTAMERLPENLNTISLKMGGHTDDFCRHIRQELLVPGNPEFKAGIEKRIVDRSRGNFLWVRLAVQRVNQCHSHEDIEAAIQEFPIGMESIYDRMASSIASIDKPNIKALAARIMEIVSCCLRVLRLDELSQALIESGIALQMLDLRRTVLELCGGFVVVDGDGNVSLVHHTAREYLVKSTQAAQNPYQFSVNRQIAHRQLFLSCMQSLMAPGLRAKVGRNHDNGFLEYATDFWSSHLAVIRKNDPKVMAVLKKFLTGNWVLTWIHALASKGRLRLLVGASKNMSTYVSRERRASRDDDSILSHLELNLVRNWAVDILRILGKFGRLLKRNPEAIYKLIPPFCPKATAIYQQFGKTEERVLSVKGLSTDTWDDVFARISLGSGPSLVLTSSVLSAGLRLAVLATRGEIYLYDTSDFMELQVSPIQHGEHVYRIQLNSTATMLATYGYRTTKIWNLTTNQCEISVPSVESKTKPLVLQFTNDNSRLLVGTDDRKIRSLCLSDIDPKWHILAEFNESPLEGQYMLTNAASHMAISSDDSMAIVAYRSFPLSAWEIDGPAHIGYCRRKDSSMAVRELRELVSHPYEPQILGLNLEGDIFKWSPYEDDVDELPVNASKLAISKDGLLFAAGDTQGRVNIYVTSTFSLLYRLVSQDPVFGLSFSPDSRRIYDNRGSYVNVWEPNALARFSESSYDYTTDADSDTCISTPCSSEALAVISGAIDPITALAGCPLGRYFCTGTERGVVALHDALRGGRPVETIHKTAAQFTVDKIAWSNDGMFLAFTDVSKVITILSVSPDSLPEVNAQANTRVSVKKQAPGSIFQLLFHPDASHILVHSSSSILVISVTTSLVEHTLQTRDPQMKWMVHPSDRSLLMGLGATTCSVIDWKLNEHQLYNISWPQHKKTVDEQEGEATVTDSTSTHLIDRMLVTQDKRHLVIQAATLERHKQTTRLFFIELSTIKTREYLEMSGLVPSINPKRITQALSADIFMVLSFLNRDRLVYLSRDFSVCTLPIRWETGLDVGFDNGRQSVPGTVAANLAIPTSNSIMKTTSKKDGVELFSFPGDWINRDLASLCTIWSIERSLLCMRNGDAVVIRCSGLV